MSMLPDLSSWRGPTSSFCAVEGAGPKYVSGMSAPMDGGAGAMSSSCPNAGSVGINAGVMTTIMAAIPNRDSLKFIF
jgi:hypothetical protein